LDLNTSNGTKKFCSHCGFQSYRKWDKFCSDCGTSLIKPKSARTQRRKKKVNGMTRSHSNVNSKERGEADFSKFSSEEISETSCQDDFGDIELIPESQEPLQIEEPVGRCIEKAFIYFSGLPNVRWYSYSTEQWHMGIKSSTRYVAFIQKVIAYDRGYGKGVSPMPMMECWYGITDSKSIRECCFNSLHNTITLDLTKRGEEGMPMITDSFYFVKEGGISYEQASTIGRNIIMGYCSPCNTDKEWKGVFGQSQIPRYGEGVKYYTVTRRSIDEAHQLNVLSDIIP